MPIVAKTDELQRLYVDLAAWANGLDDRTGLVVRKAAFDVEAHSMANAPVVTGTLRNSHHTEITANNAMVQSARVVAEADYAPWVEWGTSRMAPRLFMTRAIDTVEPSFVAALQAIAGPPGPGWGI